MPYLGLLLAGIAQGMLSLTVIGRLMDLRDTTIALLVVALLPGLLVIAFAGLRFFSRQRGGTTHVDVFETLHG